MSTRHESPYPLDSEAWRAVVEERQRVQAEQIRDLQAFVSDARTYIERLRGGGTRTKDLITYGVVTVILVTNLLLGVVAALGQ